MHEIVVHESSLEAMAAGYPACHVPAALMSEDFRVAWLPAVSQGDFQLLILWEYLALVLLGNLAMSWNYLV